MLKDLSTFLTKPGLLEKLPVTSTRAKIKEGENRFVSILFADIKGFTDMSELLDHEIVQELFDQLMISFSDCVIKYGGYVDKYEGDLIMAHFGSFEFMEQVSRRAVYAGLEIIEVINRYNKIRISIPELAKIETDLAIRVGINSGWVTTGKIGLKREGDFTIYGDVVNLASRMESNGFPNKITLPKDIKKELEAYFEFDFYRRKKIKGIEKPIPLYFVKDIKPNVIAREVSNTDFVGRQEVLQHLTDIYEQSISQLNENQALQIVGIKAAAGIGKTRLTREFCKAIDSEAYISEISPMIQNPYTSFLSLLRAMLGLSTSCSGTTTTREFSQAFKDLLRKLSPQSAKYLQEQKSIYHDLLCADMHTKELDPQETVSEINYALLILIRIFAEKSRAKGLPLMLIFEDLHFADERSINALEYLVKNLLLIELPFEQTNFRIILLMLYRDAFSPNQLIQKYPLFEEIELRELDEREIEQFMGNKINDKELVTKFLPVLAKKSAGNPMFIEEWLHLLHDNLKSGADFCWDTGSIPNSISALILTRLNKLDPQSRKFTQHATTIGMCFKEYLLRLLEADLRNCPAAEIEIEPIYASDILSKSDDNTDEVTLTFKHELYLQAIYNTMLKSNRKILHGIVAEIIEKVYHKEIKNWYFALADHYERAGMQTKCLHYLNKSVEYAHSLFMNKKEMDLCDKLLQYSPKAEINQIMVRKATLNLDMGDFQTSEDILNSIDFQNLEIGLPRDKYILARIRILLTRHDLKTVREYIDLHLPEITTDSAKITGVIYQLDARRLDVKDKEFISDAKSVLQKLDPSQSQYSRLENIMGLFYFNRGEYAQALSFYDQSILHCKHHKIFSRWAHQSKANLLCKLGKPDEAMTEYNIALNLARYLDDESGISKLLCDMGTKCLKAGDDKDAMRMLTESLDISIRTGNLKQQGLAVYNLAKLYDSLGDLPNAKKMLSQSLKINYGLSNHQALSQSRDLMGDILYQEGKIDYAGKMYSRNLDYQMNMNDIEGIAHTYGNLGNIAAEKRDYMTAESYYRQQQTMLSKIGDIEGEGKAWYNWGLLDAERGQLAQAMEKLSSALNLFEKGGFTMFINAAKDYLAYLDKQSKNMTQPD
jgi:adenylate cyclase